MPSTGFDEPPLSGTGDSSHDSDAPDPNDHRHGDMDYGIWQEGGRPTHVKCYTDIGLPPAQNTLDGMFRQYIKLKSQFPFEVLNTTTLTDGPMSGCQVIVIKPKAPFPLLKLPREIKDEIYTYAVTPNVFKHPRLEHDPLNNGCIQFEQMTNPPRCRHATLKSHWRFSRHMRDIVVHHESVTPGLLLTNKQIHQEALPVLYGRNCFQIFSSDHDSFSAFLQQVGNSSKYIRNLRLEHFWEEPDSCKHLERFVHLRRLSVGSPCDLDDERVFNPAKAARLFFDKAFRWISGVASTQEDEDQLCALKYVQADCPKSCSSECPGEDVIRNGISCQWMEEFRNELKRIIVSRSGVVIPFLKFPRNIRDMIYTYAMEYQGRVATKRGYLEELYIHKDRDTGRLTRGLGSLYTEGRGRYCYDCHGLSASLTPGPLRVNHQVYRESVQLLYGMRSFRPRYKYLEAFLEWIGNSHVHLRKMDIGAYPRNPNIVYKLLNLDELWLDVKEINEMDEEAPDGCPKSAAKTFFERASHWIEGVGALREGGRSAAIERIRPTWSPGDSRGHEDWCRMFKEELKKLFK